MSLMGVVMMVGIVVSNSILIVEFTHRLIDDEAMPVRAAVAHACRIRYCCPILMTSLATVFRTHSPGAQTRDPARKLTLRWPGPSLAA